MGLDLFLWGFVHLELEQIPSVSVITTPHDVHCPGSVSGACGTVAGTVGNSAGTDGDWFWFVLGRLVVFRRVNGVIRQRICGLGGFLAD